VILLTALAGTLLPDLAAAVPHGGQYRGPEDTVPPGGSPRNGRSGGNGPTTPGPTGPSSPKPGSPTGPSTGPGTGPGGGPGGGPTTGPRGVDVGPDLSLWQYWWEFNKDPFLQLKRRLHTTGPTTGDLDFVKGRGYVDDVIATQRPSETDIKSKVIPALRAALQDGASSRDLRSSCLIALAKIGRDAAILPLFKVLLTSGDQEERETAALAMGIAALPEATDDLLALARDDAAGRKLVGRAGVDFRTRSFACYGLGLIAYATTDLAVKTKVFDAMRSLLDDATDRRDVHVAALNAIRLLRPDMTSERGKALGTQAVDYLLAYLERTGLFAQVQAHALTAVANLVGRGDEKGAIKSRLLDILTAKHKQWMYQSAILALGQMAVPEDGEVCDAIRAYASNGRDEQAKLFACIALGQIGGERNKEFLRQRLVQDRTQGIHKPWIALGLAIMDWSRGEADASVDATSADVLRQFEDVGNPQLAAGLGIALGIMRDTESGDRLHERLGRVKNDDEAAGYLAVALGLMNYRAAKEDIEKLLEKATRRDKLLTQCAIALGLMGDKEVSLGLIARLKEPNPVAVFSALAQGLGFIGDRRSISGLVELLSKKDLQPLNRAFAAVALGLICDKEDLPWNSKISVNINYRANVETLTGGATGILDIL
jgi:HEAT repeat protein